MSAPGAGAKRKEPLGTWDSDAFQVLQHEERIQFMEPFGLMALPTVGVYGEDYNPSIPLVLVELEDGELDGAREDEPCTSYVMIHERPLKAPCQKLLCDRDDEVNVLLHAWMCVEDEAVESALVGLYGGLGVESVHLDTKDGIPFEEMLERPVGRHSGNAFSPCNNQLVLSDAFEAHSFFVVAKSMTRASKTFHLIASSQRYKEAVRLAAREANTTVELVKALQALLGADDVHVQRVARLLGDA